MPRGRRLRPQPPQGGTGAARRAAPARSRRTGVDPTDPDVPGDDLLGELENLDDWLTQRIPAVPGDVHDLPTECFARAVPPAAPVAPPRRAAARSSAPRWSSC